MVEQLNSMIGAELVESVYLYAYKRVNNRADAEDLAQDILVHALAGIRANKPQNSFYSWFWQLAHNRWCVFLAKKSKQHISLDQQGGQLIGSLRSEDEMDHQLISDEDVRELNFTISRLSQIHREIIILFYVKQKTIKEIAHLLAVPEGTVKRRLFDARQSIKEGLGTMEQSIGRKAYAPVKLNKWGGYGMPKYWDRLSSLIKDNIFAACAKKALTINEIADEIGVAPVYLEREIEPLVEWRFLKNTGGGKYLTNFVVFDANVYTEFKFRLSQIYKDLGKEMIAALYSIQDEIRKIDFYGNTFDFEYLLWILLPFGCTSFAKSSLEIYHKQHSRLDLPKYDKDYRIAATVLYPEQEEIKRDIKGVRWSNLHTNFATGNFRNICYANLYQAKPFPNRDDWIHAGNVSFLLKLAKDPEAILSDTEQEQAAVFIKQGVIKNNNGHLIVQIPIIEQSVLNQALLPILDRETKPLTDKYVEQVSELGDTLLLPEIREDLMEEYVNWIMQGAFWPLPFILYYAINEKVLQIPENYDQSAAALYLRVDA